MAMIITKISSLKKFGIFRDFSWNEELPEFKKFNLIYGWNRSGKTTLSRVFASCEKKCVYDEDEFKEYPEGGEFEVATDGGITVKDTDVDTNNLSIRVFNRDFIDKNISFDPTGSCTPIVYVSEVDIETKNRLNSFRSQTEPLAEKHQHLKNELENAVRAEDRFRRSVGKKIARFLTVKASRDRYYTYDKRKVKETIAQVGINNFDSQNSF